MNVASNTTSAMLFTSVNATIFKTNGYLVPSRAFPSKINAKQIGIIVKYWDNYNAGCEVKS
jgi:hypothetical protein